MFTDKKSMPTPPPPMSSAPTPTRVPSSPSDVSRSAAVTLLTVVGQGARIHGKFDITDSIQIECEIGGELNVGGKLVIGQNGVVKADVITVDAIVMGHYEGNMIATGDVEITETGRVSGNIQTDSLVIAKGGFFNGNIAKMNESNRKVIAIDERRGDLSSSHSR